MGDDRQIIVIKEKSSGFSMMKALGIFFFICSIPFLCLLIIPVGVLTTVGACMGAICAIQNYGAWVLAAVLGVPVVLALKDRVSGQRTITALTQRITLLEHELDDARHAILLLEEEKEFTRLLEQEAGKNSSKEPAKDSAKGSSKA